MLADVNGRADQVDGGVEEDPDNVYKVPIDGAGFNTPMVFSRIGPTQAVDPDNRDDHETA